MTTQKILFPLLCLSFAVSIAVPLCAEEAIKHKLLLNDESRGQILYVDQIDPSKNWVIPTPKGGEWDAQLIGNNRILVAATSQGGYKEYDWTTRKAVKEVLDKKYAPTRSAVRFPDGRTVIARSGKRNALFVFDADGKEVKEIALPQVKSEVRLIRRSPRNTIYFGNHGSVWEIDLDGKELRRFDVPDAKYNYQVSELPSGNLLVTTGYNCTLVEIDKENKVVKTFGKTNIPSGEVTASPPASAAAPVAPEGLYYLFFAKFQVLPNGHIVTATWTGHGAEDSKKGQQVVEFDKEGKVVWKWHDPQLAGSINGVIVLDHLDIAKWSEE